MRLHFAVFLFLMTRGLGGEDAHDWPLFRGDPQMQGISQDILQLPLKPAWSLALGDGIPSTAAIVNQRVYIGDSGGIFYCIGLEKGEEIWKFNTEDTIESSPCVVGDAVFFGSGNGKIYALNLANGAKRWEAQTDEEVLSGCSFYTSETLGKTLILAGSNDNHLYAFNSKDGTVVWKYATENFVNGTPTISTNDKSVIIGGCDGFLYMIDVETGKLKEKVEIEAYISNSVAVRDGIVYVAHYGNRVEAVSIKDEKEIWKFGEREFPYFAAPAVTDTAVIAGCRDKRLYAIGRQNGEELWSFKTRGRIDSSPVVSGEHTYFGSDDGFLYAVHLTSGEEAFSIEIGAEIHSSPAISGRFLVIGDEEGNLHAFQSTE